MTTNDVPMVRIDGARRHSPTSTVHRRLPHYLLDDDGAGVYTGSLYYSVLN